MVAFRMTIIDYLGKWETTTKQQQIQSLEGCEKHAALKMIKSEISKFFPRNAH
jgi:hypothetical protein